MTRRKSDAQLDAEAAAAPDNRSVDDVLNHHRALQRGEVASILRLHAHYPTADDVKAEDGESYGSQVGQPWSGRMKRYVGGLAWDDDKGDWVNDSLRGAFPWADAFQALRKHCRGVHHAHLERPEFRGSLCHALVSLTIIGEQSIGAASTKLGISPQRAGATLRMALLWVEAEMQRRAHLREQKEQARTFDEGSVAHVHRPLDGLHAVECPNRKCREDAA